MFIFYRRYRRDSIVLHYVVRNGQIRQTMGTMRDHDAGWSRLRVVYVRARRYFVDSSLTLIQISNRKKSNFLSQTILFLRLIQQFYSRNYY